MSANQAPGLIVKKPRHLIGLPFIVYSLTIIGLLLVTGSEPFNVFFGTTPLLIFVIAYTFIYESEYRKWLIWAFPIILSFGFYAFWTSNNSELIQRIDGPHATLFNIISSFILNFLMISLGSVLQVFEVVDRPAPLPRHIEKAADMPEAHAYEKKFQEIHHYYAEQFHNYKEHTEQLEQELAKARHALSMSEKSITVSLRGIEDKCKAINFVIGRVYSNKKCGTPEARKAISIPRDLYNEFSEIVRDFSKEKAHLLVNVLVKVQGKLKALEDVENKHFNLDPAGAIELVRDASGNDRIIDVLASNDKDPIKDYHKEALEVTEKLLDLLLKKST